MKRIKKFVIGGIQNKLFYLILFTVLLLSATSVGVSIHQSDTLSKVAAESGERQQAAISEVTSKAMNEVVTESLKNSNKTKAQLADEMFSEAGYRVTFLADYAEKLFANPENYTPKAYSGPKRNEDGIWTAKVIYAEGVDPDDPVIVSKVGLLANMFDMMIFLCPSFKAANVYIALPEGAHLSVSKESSSWFAHGRLKRYDPRKRGWYQRAEAEGKLIFTEGEYDANTGEYCIECAAPAYGPDGSLMAVIGTDLYLDDMQKVLMNSSGTGEFGLLINREGHAVLAPQELAFPMAANDRGKDLRESEIEVLSKLVSDAIKGEQIGIIEGKLADGEYYITASSIESTGWVLISAFSEELTRQPVAILQNKNDEILSDAANEYQSRTENSRHTAVILLGLVTILMLTLAWFLGRHIVRPLNTITKRISELKEGDLEFKMEPDYQTGDEVEELAQSFASLSHKTVQYVETVKRVTAEKERISTELALATKIQLGMLPNIYPAFPDRKEFDIYATMDPAKEVGGDFYDFFLVDEDHLCMVIADVSGKGVPAALFMMVSKIILSNNAMLGISPAQILENTNKTIASSKHEHMFVTVWLGILTISTGRLTAANAGHDYPVIQNEAGSFELYTDKHSGPVGIKKGLKYKEYELQLSPGRRLFVYTDGVPEATDKNNEMLGTDRMIEALNKDPKASPEQILKNVHSAVDEFVQDAEQFDDQTMLCLEYRGI